MVERSGFRKPRNSRRRKPLRKRPLASPARNSSGARAVEDTEFFDGRGVQLVYEPNGGRLISWTGDVQDKQEYVRGKRLALRRGTMRPSGVRMFWASLHEPRIVTFVTMICYAVLFLFGTYCLAHPQWGPAPFWQISAAVLTLFPPVALVAAWRGAWQIERPALIGVSGGLLLNVLTNLHNAGDTGFRFGYVVMLAVALQAFVSRWVRIKTSYESPGRMAEKYKKTLDSHDD